MGNLVSIRLLSQQLASPQFSRPSEVVAHLGAMQAQDYRMMRWAVGMRMCTPSYEAFRKDYDRGAIIRMHMLRGTWQLIAAEDYGWMFDLCAPKSLAVIKGWMNSNGISISSEEIDSIKEIIISTLKEERSADKEALAAAVEQATGKQMDPHRLSYHIRLAELDGTLVSGDLHPSKATYSLAADKIPQRSRLDRDEALALLARKYFQSHSPATLEDFVWWSGMNLSDCRKGIELLEGCIVTERWKGREYYISDTCRTRGFRKGRTLLLPPFDEYLVGYKSREVVLDPEFSHRAHNKCGMFYPVIARDGIICGNWRMTGGKVQTEFFGEQVPVAECIPTAEGYLRLSRL